MPKEGIFAKVLRGGTVKTGDGIKITGSKPSDVRENRRP
jgi:MOSC domain-containing protein YiiM